MKFRVKEHDYSAPSLSTPFYLFYLNKTVQELNIETSSFCIYNEQVIYTK